MSAIVIVVVILCNPCCYRYCHRSCLRCCYRRPCCCCPVTAGPVVADVVAILAGLQTRSRTRQGVFLAPNVKAYNIINKYMR
jgi:hypothetical protein